LLEKSQITVAEPETAEGNGTGPVCFLVHAPSENVIEATDWYAI